MNLIFLAASLVPRLYSRNGGARVALEKERGKPGVLLPVFLHWETGPCREGADTGDDMGKIKYYDRDPNAALTGMMCLSLEERGAYNTILDLIYAHGGQVVDDDRFLAGWMRCDVRVWKRIKARLFGLGKLYAEGGCIRNATADVVIDRALLRVTSARDAGRASAAKRASKSSKNNNKPATPVERPLQLRSASLSVKVIEDNDQQSSLISCARDKTEFQKVFEAGSEVFPNLATASTASIHQWLNAGCDTELDIIPELRRHSGRPIKTWNYFTGGIMDAKATRTTQPQEGYVNGHSARNHQRGESRYMQFARDMAEWADEREQG